MTDPYSVLGIDSSASDADIKAAYRKLAIQFHPDKNPGNKDAEEKFKTINAAYDKIKEPEKRREHDSRSGGSTNGWHFHQEGFDAGAFFDEIMRNKHSNFNRRNRNYQTHCSISLLDAFNGCDIILKVHEKEISFKVPAGVETGTRLRIQGAGDREFADLPPGDLIVQIVVQRDAVFARQGSIIYSDVYVSAIDAMLGLPITVQTLDGSSVDITPDAGLKSGSKVRIAGKGMPIVASHARGDHVVTFHLTIPDDISEEQKKLLEEIKRLSN